jgi:glutamate dehydrogenase
VAEFSKAIARLMEERVPAASDPPPLRTLLEGMRALLTPIERPVADALARQLFGKGAIDHLLTRDPHTWAAITVDAYRFLSPPTASIPRVRVFRPELSRDGWESPDVVIETNMSDRPFIVDTIRESLQVFGAKPHLLLHPVIGVERDQSGRLLSIGPPEAVGQHESFVHTEIERAGDLGTLEADLIARLRAVLAATDDYAAMRAQAERHAEALRSGRLPPPWNEDTAEIAAFLEWLTDKSFVFLGYREYEFSGQGSERRGAVRRGSGLGLLRDEARSSYFNARAIPEALRRRLNEPPLLLVSKANAESPIHRRAPMDYIGLKHIDPSGVVVGEYRFLGLFTAKAYGEEPSQVPLSRGKLAEVLVRQEVVEESHDYRLVVELFNTIPKEEIFASGAAELEQEIALIRAAEGSERVRVALRPDPLGRGLIVVVILPRDRYSADLQRRAEQRLLDRLGGPLLSRHVALDDFDRVRLHFYLGTQAMSRATGAVELEADFADLLRTWEDRLFDQLQQEMPRADARQLLDKYLPAFSAEYRGATDAPLAIRDIRCLETLAISSAPQIDVTNQLSTERQAFTAIKLYLLNEDLVLSDFLPILENLGLRVFEEDHLDVPLSNVGTVRIHTFLVQDRAEQRLQIEQVGLRLASALIALRAGSTESDHLNRLVLEAGLSWREVDAVRAYVGHAQQAQVAARELIIEAVAEHGESAALLFEAFRTKFDPAIKSVARERATALLPAVQTRFLASLDTVASVQHDRILRALWATVEATVRTNFYVTASQVPTRTGHATIALKLDSSLLSHLPRPRPLYEMYVHAPHVCGIHLRAGRVARGGVRLSDRPDDFRTEVLGLMKTQTVKNAVIVPSGAKGGFVVRRRSGTGSSGASPATVVSAYRAFIGGLLDLTDNVVQGVAVPPPGVLAYDDADPYLVVAADKGTAAFSDVANEVAAEYGFWLGDAFASGGRHGYDHKREGITARGAWECVRQHFRSLGRDADREPLLIIGIGDMSGDVFGNGLLQSPHVKLLAAFNHQHILIDPDPNPELSYGERRRLFSLPRSGWSDYDPNLISEGGGVFPRSAKRIRLSAAAQRMLGVGDEAFSGEELVQAVLRADVDLLWNGGIGTYVKASDETHPEVGDTANDGVRVDASEVRAKVVAEGGNLGFTQRARIQFALQGGLINTDAIDNSAGVDLSDHEVNLKIALRRPLEAGTLSLEGRLTLLSSLTDEVCRRVLSHNRRQARVLTLDQLRSRTQLSDFRSHMSQLESDAQLDRQLEHLPNREVLRTRRGAFLGLTRPEIAILLAYSKLHLQRVLLESELPDDPFLERYLRRSFPAVVNERFGEAVRTHRLRREIITVTLANQLVDSMGATFATRTARDTGSDIVDVVKAWTTVAAITEADNLIDRMLDVIPSVTPEAEAHAAFLFEHSLERATKWIVETQRPELTAGQLVKAFDASVASLRHGVAGLLPEEYRAQERSDLDALMTGGFPPSLAQALASLGRTADLLEIDQIATDMETPLEITAEVYYRVEELVDLEWIRQSLREAAGEDRWERRAAEGLSGALVYARRQLTRNVLLCREGGGDVQHCLGEYAEQHVERLDRLRRLIDDIRSARQTSLAALVVVTRELDALAGRG